ncbi:MAG TPA: alanine--tRNA ligase [Gemmatimonadaceae bacterium]|nr:alanine--tRNA ligase [Gemmatimonadaceae bacterium]
MQAAEIRKRFLDYFARHGHAVRPSSSLVPADDPTLLFTNAGMVQFKRVFLGMEPPPDGNRRATTSQKCVRAGGKHNDLEQVGHTARHHTFFEMLGNFSFGDYFKRDAIRFAWEFVTGDPAKGNLGIPKEHVRVSVFHEDDEARQLWKDEAHLPDSRIYGLSAKDNFWQMADTGPCGPCTELYVDLAYLAKDWAFPREASGEWTRTDITEFSLDAFVEGAEAGRFLEIWNLVFMQFDRQADGTMVPLPRPSVDTGAGLERIAAVLQGVANNFHSDVFAPLIEEVERVVDIVYAPGYALGARATPTPRATPALRTSEVLRAVDPSSFRVIADHARAVAFLLADGVFPSNEGRGYVLRRILRRAVRHAWLLGRREPTLVHVVEKVIATMRDVYPELDARRTHIVETTRAEEERFLATIDGGMAKFDELAPAQASTQGSTRVHGTIAGEDAFRLYDTFGFPIDLTELMAEERGYRVDIAGFEAALAGQREQSREERKSRKLSVAAGDLEDTAAWERAPDELKQQRFVGYETTEVETRVLAARGMDHGRVAVILHHTPFYAESGGQVSDTGEIVGVGWRVDVDDVKKVDGQIAAIGTLTGKVAFERVVARVAAPRRRDIMRNHTATHLLHAALRKVLGDHVHQAGSVVEPDRLRFDFTHHGPVTPAELEAIEHWVNAGIWQNEKVWTTERAHADAVAAGAMALFGEKYGETVRVVEIPTRSMELCGGTHVSSTGQILVFRVVSETGVSAGVRRIVAITGPKAFATLRENERALAAIGDALKVNVHAAGTDAVARKVEQLIADRKALEKKLDEALRGGGNSAAQRILASGAAVGPWRVVGGKADVAALAELQALGDSVREQLAGGVGVLGGVFEEGKAALVFVVGDALRAKGVSAGDLVKGFAAQTGGRGGGKPHLAQMGADPATIDRSIADAQAFVAAQLAGVT